MSTRATDLGDMSSTELHLEVSKRRASYQRALSAVKARGENGLFEAIVHSHLTDVQAMRGVPLEVEMYAAVVNDGEGGTAIRGVYATWRQAKERLEMEVAAKTHVPLEWDDYGDGFATTRNRVNGMQYETEKVQVHA